MIIYVCNVSVLLFVLLIAFVESCVRAVLYTEVCSSLSVRLVLCGWVLSAKCRVPLLLNLGCIASFQMTSSSLHKFLAHVGLSLWFAKKHWNTSIRENCGQVFKIFRLVSLDSGCHEYLMNCIRGNACSLLHCKSLLPFGFCSFWIGTNLSNFTLPASVGSYAIDQVTERLILKSPSHLILCSLYYWQCWSLLENDARKDWPRFAGPLETWSFVIKTFCLIMVGNASTLVCSSISTPHPHHECYSF